MARRDEDEVTVVERGGSPVMPFLLGMAAGAVLALLFAPTSGQELRASIGTRARRFRDVALEKAGALEEEVGERYARARARVEEELDSARRTVGEGRQAARDVVEAGKAAAGTAREELERRLAGAREARRAARRTPPDGEAGV